MKIKVKPFASILRVGILFSALFLVACSGLPAQAQEANPVSVPLTSSTQLQLGQVLVTGVITGLANDEISIGEVAFRRDDQTQMPSSLLVGTEAQVLAIRLPDNTHYALQVQPAAVPAQAASDAGQGTRVENDDDGEFEMYGVVESIQENDWLVSGNAVRLISGAEVQSGIQAGDTVKVEGVLDGSVLAAREIKLELGDDDQPGSGQSGQDDDGDDDGDDDREGNELYGIVDSIDGTSWVIGGTAFTVGSGITQVDNNVQVGSRVEVKYTQQADGSFLALAIEAEDDDDADDMDDDLDDDDRDDDMDDDSSGDQDDGPDDDDQNDDLDDDSSDDDSSDDDDDSNDDNGGDDDDSDDNDDNDDDSNDDD